MTSAGNDIVSLTAINVTRTKGPEFYSKIISEPEKELFASLESETLLFEHYVWLLWSVKEAAFKYLHRLDPCLVFTPVKFVVKTLQIPPGLQIANAGPEEITGKGLDNERVVSGTISHQNQTLYSKTFLCNDFISSVVNHSDGFGNVYWGIKRVEQTDYKFLSAAVREFAIETLQEVLTVSGLVIGKNSDEVPVLLNGGEEMGVPVSLSHHERWVGYSFSF